MNFNFKKINVKIIFILVLSLFPQILIAEQKLFINKNSFLKIDSCNWIPIGSRNFKNIKYRICESSNADFYEIKYNLKLNRLIYKKLIGNLNSPLIFKDKKDLINQNKDTLKYSKLINGDFYRYNCRRDLCNSVISNFTKVGIKKYYWD